MGQSGSKAARNLRLPRTTPTTKQPSPNKITTREQMLHEEEDIQEASKLHDNLKYFLNPKELKTPITPVNPSENVNVQALRNRKHEDDMALGRANSKDIASMICQLRKVDSQQRELVASKYGMDAETARLLERFLDPVI